MVGATGRSSYVADIQGCTESKGRGIAAPISRGMFLKRQRCRLRVADDISKVKREDPVAPSGFGCEKRAVRPLHHLVPGLVHSGGIRTAYSSTQRQDFEWLGFMRNSLLYQLIKNSLAQRLSAFG